MSSNHLLALFLLGVVVLATPSHGDHHRIPKKGKKPPHEHLLMEEYNGPHEPKPFPEHNPSHGHEGPQEPPRYKGEKPPQEHENPPEPPRGKGGEKQEPQEPPRGKGGEKREPQEPPRGKGEKPPHEGHILIEEADSDTCKCGRNMSRPRKMKSPCNHTLGN